MLKLRMYLLTLLSKLPKNKVGDVLAPFQRSHIDEKFAQENA
jgi:hypothetical protein